MDKQGSTYLLPVILPHFGGVPWFGSDETNGPTNVDGSVYMVTLNKCMGFLLPWYIPKLSRRSVVMVVVACSSGGERLKNVLCACACACACACKKSPL